jgi:hypothetical protein
MEVIQSTLSIPPLAALATYEEAARPGLGVEENVAKMRRYNRVEARLYEISAAALNPTPEWEVKCAMSLHLYLDAEHSQALRDRVAELRKPPHHMDTPLDSAFEAFLDEARYAESTIELLVTLFRVVRPALLAAYREHLEAVNPLFDFPTVRLLRQAVGEEEQMIAWGDAALAACVVGEKAAAEAGAWEAHLRAYLKAAGGVSGLEPVPADLTLPKRRTHPGGFVANVEPKRDSRSGDIYNFLYRANDVYCDSSADWDERNLALMWKRFHEMDVPEMMASIVLQTPGKPWGYYLDMGRQLWDEARHAMMGEVWMARHGVDWSRYPNHVGWSLHLNLDRAPLERHVILYFIEQSLMNGRTGKQEEWRIAQRAADPLATYFQDYDWADEVLHAQFGRKWLKPEVGTVKDLLQHAEEIASRHSPTLEARRAQSAQEDWWPRIVRDVLGHESTSTAGADNPLTPRFEALASG